jgi:pimeloyl-ACP methyl ester carboxylesterase
MTFGYLDVNGASLCYEQQGNGDPLVLIHSGLAHMAMWEDQMPAFSQRYRVIRYDVRGWGNSRGSLTGYSDYGDLRELLRHLGINRAALLGISSGGGIAIDFSLAYPDMVYALIAVAPSVSGHKLPPDELMTQLRSASYEAYQSDKKGLAAEFTTQLWFDGPFRSPNDVDPLVRQHVLDMIRYNYELPDGQAHPESLEPPAAPRLAQIKAPVLLVIGDQDVPPITATVNILEKKIPRAKKAVIQGTAHFPNMEKPEEFNRIVLDFLDGIPSPYAEDKNT